jgi:alpha-methylacyl-CoA racemase
MTGWGQTGPLKAAAGHDINYLSLTGVLHAIGQKGAPPTVPLNVVADMGGGGMLLALGMVSAMLEAKRSGDGQVVDAAMTDGAALLGAMMYGFKAGGRWNNERASNLLDGGAYFYGTYECADGKHFSVGAIEPQFHTKLLELLGLEKSDFLPQEDTSQWPRRRKLLEQAFRTRPRDAWSAVFEGTDACAAPVLNWDEAPAHPHNRNRETFVEISGVVQPAPAPRFSRTPCGLPTPPQTVGQETDEILVDWGIPQSQLAHLKESGAI